MKTKYTYLQKYTFNYFRKLGYNFFYKQEILLIPKNIKYTPLKNILFNKTHTFTKEELCLILEKYLCCKKILNIAPLTKYLHLNFIYLKQTDPDYYKIKINYAFAIPKIQNDINFSIFHLNNLYSKKKRAESTTATIYHLFDVPIEKYSKTVIKCTRLKKIALNKFLHIIKKTKFQRTHQFFNFLKETKKDLWYWSDLTEHNYPQSTKSAITYDGYVGYKGVNAVPYEEIIENFDYLEATHFNARIECISTLKFLNVNLFKIIKINNDFDLFFFLFYNYMLLNNMYINSNNEIMQIIQNDINKQNFMSAVKKFYKAIAFKLPYETILIPAIPIEDILIGDIDWLFNNLNTILDTMLSTIGTLVPFELKKNIIFSKFSNLIYCKEITNLKYFLNIQKLPTKETILNKREYSETTAVYNWTTCLVVYFLKLENLHTFLPKIYENMKFFEIELEQLLKYTNIYSENLNRKTDFGNLGIEHKKTLESKKFPDAFSSLFF